MPEALGLRMDAPATVIRGLLENGDEHGYLSQLHSRGLTPQDARAAGLFGADSGPGRLGVVRRRARCAACGGRTGRPPGRRRSTGVGAGHRDQAPVAAQAVGRPAARTARRAPARLPRGPRERARLRGARGRVHPGDRRAGPAVLRLPGLPPGQARQGARARNGRGHHAHADGRRLSAAGALQQVLRRGHGPARAGGARHGRPPRHVRARLHAPLLRGHGLSRPRELHGQLQRAG